MEPTVCTSQVNCFDSYSFTFKGSHMMQRHPKTNQQKKNLIIYKKNPKLNMFKYMCFWFQTFSMQQIVHSTLEIHKN